MRITRRHKILFVVVILLIGWILVWNVLPIGDGYWNEKQIQKIGLIKSSDSFCFGVMGDNHEGIRTFDKIIADLNQKKPAFMIDNGDLVSQGSKEKYRIFYQKIQESQVPFLVGIGNHDIRDNGRSNYFNIFGDFYYSFSYNDSLFIVLDDANQVDIGKQQLDFLENELKKDFKHKFIFMHVPVFNPKSSSIRLNNRMVPEDMKFNPYLSDGETVKEFESLVHKYNATTVFSSHIHGYFNETINNTPYLITGGGGGALFGFDPEHYFYHYIIVCVNGDNISYNVVKFKSFDNNSFERILSVMWMYLYSFVYTNMVDIVLFIIIFILLVDIFYDELRRVRSRIRRHKRVKVQVR